MEILSWIENQSSFVQGLIAAAIFSATIWLLRTILKLAAQSGTAVVKNFEKQLLIRHLLYRHYINSDNIHLSAYGFYTVAFITITWVLRGILIFVFFFFVDSMLKQNWLWVACSWFAFNAFFEAYQWLKDISDPKHIKKINKEIIKEFISEIPEHQAKIFTQTDKNS